VLTRNTDGNVAIVKHVAEPLNVILLLETICFTAGVPHFMAISIASSRPAASASIAHTRSRAR